MNPSDAVRAIRHYAISNNNETEDGSATKITNAKGLKTSFFDVLHDENAKQIFKSLATIWTRVLSLFILKITKAFWQLMSFLLRQSKFVAILAKVCTLFTSARQFIFSICR